MNKFKSFIKLLKFFWDNSDQVLKMLNVMQGKLSLLVDALRNSATALVAAAYAIGFSESQVGDVFTQVGTKLDAVKVPKLGLSTSGFGDVLVDALNKILTPPPPAPPQNVKNELNKLRVLNQPSIDKQTSPFSALNNLVNPVGVVINEFAGSAKTSLESTASGLRKFSDLLETME
jgi:hypothetical protein